MTSRIEFITRGVKIMARKRVGLKELLQKDQASSFKGQKTKAAQKKSSTKKKKLS